MENTFSAGIHTITINIHVKEVCLFMGALIELKNIGYSYHTLSGETGAIKDISFSVEEGEFVALVGPSGCGKSTLLSIIAGLLSPESGTIVVNNPDGSLHYPRIGYMLQHDHLFEWRTIYQNVTLGLEIHHALTPDRIAHVEQLLSDYGLEKFKNKRPCELSGGMKQRAALIRTLALDPQLLLLDEPFSALDYQTRLMVSSDICQLIRKAGKTMIIVTHDLSEAISLSDRIIVLSKRPACVIDILDISIPGKEKGSLFVRKQPEFNDYFQLLWKEMNSHDKGS